MDIGCKSSRCFTRTIEVDECTLVRIKRAAVQLLVRIKQPSAWDGRLEKKKEEREREAQEMGSTGVTRPPLHR